MSSTLMDMIINFGGIILFKFLWVASPNILPHRLLKMISESYSQKIKATIGCVIEFDVPFGGIPY